ncbi:FxSxx-COOH cyclophane-containing RiPP peptide [Actinomadura sp. DC4]|uniref:FxSxx-COOH cyclophane-containing RiPP peptide n=1 Tax=Actinomadura sp. DC4 TaxID=3055069 RepID=UPI0025AF56CD|nr:FxSxx-COOH cyclophane-containing RiPP peptide [Actinomadura sp. DC4]MDN3353814.1 FxSxx-COOH cyclophane-containing RiPP peptide [Actinomadura sp. DC4]
MHEDADEVGGGPIDLSGVPLRALATLSDSALDRALARLLARKVQDQEVAGFQSRV